MKTYIPLLTLMLLFISCSSDDDSSTHNDDTTDDIIRIEMERLTDHSDDFEDSMVMLSFIGDEDLEVETDMELDSTYVGDQENGLAGQQFFYNFSSLKESITFETTTSAMPGSVFGFTTYKKEDVGETGDLYNVKVYHGDELFTEETISELTEDPDNGQISTAFNITEEADY